MNEPHNIDSPTPPAGDHMQNNNIKQQTDNLPPPNSTNFNADQKNPSAANIPYQGGIPVRCPRCGNVINTRFCSFCGMDLSTVYFVNMGMIHQSNTQVSNYNSQFNPQNSNFQTTIPGGYPPAKPHKHKTALLISLICILFIIVFGISGLFFNKVFYKIFNTPPIDQDGGYPPSPNAEYYHPEGVSLIEYQQLKSGMSYAKVSAIIGGDGQIVTQGEDVQGQTYIIYGWRGENNEYVSVYVTFVNDAVTEITNEGLINE